MPTPARSAPPRRGPTPKERLDRAAYDLFARDGVRSVGVDTIVARSGVAKMMLYRHYGSKDELALAFLERRWETFSRGWQAELAALRLPPRDALLKMFDLLERSLGGCCCIAALKSEFRML